MKSFAGKASLRLAAPAHITARDLLRRHLHEARLDLKWLAGAWGCKPFSVWRCFQRVEAPMQPRQIEAAITALELDEFDANEIRLTAAREAGWKIDPQFLLSNTPSTRKESQ